MLTPDSWGSDLRENQAKLRQKYGIERFEFAKPDRTIKTIGYAPRSKTWYGWSHRAIAGFKVGSRVKRGDIISPAHIDDPNRVTNGPFPVGFTARTDADAQAMAAAFAEEVS